MSSLSALLLPVIVQLKQICDVFFCILLLKSLSLRVSYIFDNV